MIEEKSEKIKQEEINRRLQEISKNLKNIPDIGFNYMEYIAALIYISYENRQILKNIANIKPEEIRYISQIFDKTLQQMREKEDSKKLFINIGFGKIMNEKNSVIFERVIMELCRLMTEIENSEEKIKPILAEAFEYILMQAAQNNEISSSNGEFYTPKNVVNMMIDLLEIKQNTAIYNPACGTGNFIIEAARNCNIYAFGEESNISNSNICDVNLWLHDIDNKRIMEDSGGMNQFFDLAIANPPFTEYGKKEVHMNQVVEKIYARYPDLLKASSYTKFLAKMLESVHRDGKIAIILPHGFLFKKAEAEYRMRRELVENGYINAIIGLPEKLFYSTKISVVILLIDKAKQGKEVLFIDASREYESNRKNNVLTEENQKKILETCQTWKMVQNYSYIANLEEIKENDYDLNIKKYVRIYSKREEINEEEVERNLHELEYKRREIQEKIENLIRKIK